MGRKTQFEKDGVSIGGREEEREREDRVVIKGCGGSARLARDKQPRRSGESSRSTVPGPLTPVAPLGLRRIRGGNKTKVSFERHAAACRARFIFVAAIRLEERAAANLPRRRRRRRDATRYRGR